METTQAEKQRMEYLLGQGVPAQAVANTIKKSRASAVVPQKKSLFGRVLNTANKFGEGVANSAVTRAITDFPQDIKQAGIEISEKSKERGDILATTIRDTDFSDTGDVAELTKESASQLLGTAGDYIGAIFTTALKAPFTQKTEDSISEALANTASSIGETEIPNSGGKTVADGVKEIGKAWDELEARDPKTARNYRLFGNASQFALDVLTGGAAKKPVTEGLEATKRGIVDIAEGTAGQIAKAELPKLKTPTRLKDIFKGKKVVPEVADDVITKADDIATVIDDVPTNIEEGLAPQKQIELSPEVKAALADPKTGLTKENQPLLSQALDTESNLLTPAEKKFLLEVDPNMYEPLEIALKNTEIDLKAPKIHEVGLDMFEEVLNKYKAVNKAAGKKVGETIERIKSLRLKNKQPVTAAIERFTTKLKGQNVLINKDGIVEVVGNSPFKGNEREIQEIYDVLKNVQEKDSAKEVLLGISQLDDKIVYGKSLDLGKTTQGLASEVASDLRALRNELMTANELKHYEKYGETIDLINKFNKGDTQQKMSVLLNTAGSQRGFKLNNFAGDILKETGHDIRDIGLILNTFMKRLPKNNSNVSRLTQIVGGNVPLSTYGIATAAGTATKNTLQKILGTDIMAEINKAGMADLAKIYSNNILPK